MNKINTSKLLALKGSVAASAAKIGEAGIPSPL